VSPYADEIQIFNEQDRISPIHPVYVIPFDSQEEMKKYFLAKTGF
jgi:protein farnesyltransferase subunit beta